MKHLAILLLTLGFVPSVLAQQLPENPAPLTADDQAWTRLQNLANGRPIVVDNTNGPPVHCFFAGVTDAYLFCNPPGNPAGVGFRFNRSDVLGVEQDLPYRTSMQLTRPERNYHPAWISSMIAGGIIVGLCATRSTDAGNATKAGFIGAGVVGLIGAPMAFLPHQDSNFAGPAYPRYAVGLPLGRLTVPSTRRIPRLHLLR